MATPTKFQAEVIKIDRHSDDVSTYEFRCLSRRPRYKAGQFIHLSLEPYNPAMHWPESHVFTVANGPSNRELIRLSISAKGEYTRRIIRELDVGAQVWMKGPYGEFIVKTETQRDVVLIAGGTEVAPFVAFMEEMLWLEVWVYEYRYTMGFAPQNYSHLKKSQIPACNRLIISDVSTMKNKRQVRE